MRGLFFLPVEDVFALPGGFGGAGVEVGGGAPLGNLGEGLFAGVAVADEPAADDGAGASDAREAVEVNFFAFVQGGVYGIEDLRHLVAAFGDVAVDYGKVVEFGCQAAGAGLLFGGFYVGGEFASLGEVDVAADAGVGEGLQPVGGVEGHAGAGVSAGGEAAGEDPVAVGERAGG